MIIGVDAFPLNKLNGGIGYYIFYLLDELVQQKPECTFILYAGSDRGDIQHFSRYPNVCIKKISAFKFSHTLWRLFSLTIVLILDKVDIFWGTTQSIPLIKRKKMRTFLTLYDFVYLLEPKSMPALLCLYFKTFMPWMVKKADFIFPISQGTASKLTQFYGLTASQIIYPPLRPEVKPMPRKEIEEKLDPHGLQYNQFVLTIGTLEPRKNFIQLVQIYLQLLKRYPKRTWLPLVIIGGGGWKNKEIRKILEEASEKYPNQIKLLGYISDADLAHYLSGARYYITFSRYEGYGMPLAEARLCGTPVICLDSAEMREAAEDDALFLNQRNLMEQLALVLLSSNNQIKESVQTNYITNQQKAKIFAETIDRLRVCR